MNPPKRVDISDRAKNDLAEILAYLEGHSPRAAAALSDTLEGAILRLGDYPELGRARPEYGQALRTLVGQNYIIFYSFDAAAVLVLRVLDGRMDIEAQLDRE